MIGLVFLIFLTLMSLVLSILAFLGYDIILDDTYIKASEEERKAMDKNAYRIQAAVIFICIAIMSACNALRGLLHMPLLTYLACAVCIGGAIYAIISHYELKKK